MKIFLPIIAIAIVFAGCKKQPVSCFKMDKSEVKVNEDISFSSCSEDAESYEWDFGDGQTSTESSPRHKYSEKGVYTVALKALDKKGNRFDRMSQTVMVREEVEITSTKTHTIEKEVFSYDWEPIMASNPEYGYKHKMMIPELTENIVENGTVTVYFSDGNRYAEFSVTLGSLTFRYEYGTGFIELFYNDLDGNATRPDNMNFKVVLSEESTETIEVLKKE